MTREFVVGQRLTLLRVGGYVPGRAGGVLEGTTKGLGDTVSGVTGK